LTSGRVISQCLRALVAVRFESGHPHRLRACHRSGNGVLWQVGRFFAAVFVGRAQIETAALTFFSSALPARGPSAARPWVWRGGRAPDLFLSRMPVPIDGRPRNLLVS
jgi:hypothetical protein